MNRAAGARNVVIVGAGPVGLTTALLLAKHGVPSTVLEAGSTISRVGSRAIVMLRSTFETFDRAAPGVGRALADRGLVWNVKRTYYKDRLVFSEVYPEPTACTYPPVVNISQVETDTALLAAAGRWYPDLISVRFGERVAAVEQTDNEVSVTTESGHRYTGAYAVGADGARSTVRKHLGIPLIGERAENRFLTADIQVSLPIAKERRFYYSPPSSPGLQVSMIPQPDDVWRIDWQVGLGLILAAETHDGRIDARIRGLVGERAAYEIRWISLYTFNNLRARTFRDRRVVLAGDAAHVLSPYGGRGLNSGIADAEVLAESLIAALSATGAGAERALDRYCAQREAAAIENIAATSRVLRVLVPPSAMRRIVRRIAIFGAPYLESCRRYIDSGPYATKTKRGVGSTRI